MGETLTQIIFALAMFANADPGVKGTQPYLQQVATAKISAEIATLNANLVGQGLGDKYQYTLVWGPVVYQLPLSDLADNTMYVAQNTKGTNEYVVAIAGTNPTSTFDWLIEDGLVWHTTPWKEGQPSAGEIALGTDIGLHILKSLRAIPSGGKKSVTVHEFLAAQIGDNPGNVYVTGHSLGGALSPVMGLWLYDQKTSWPQTTVSVYAYAGPTPGDAIFAAYYDAKLGDKTVRGWNQLDVVPHAWQHRQPPELSQVPSLYAKLPSPGTAPSSIWIKGIVDLLEVISAWHDYTQLLQKSAPGFLQSNVYANVSGCKDDFEKFLVQAAYQHINAYYMYYTGDARKPLVSCGPEMTRIATDLRAKMERERKSRAAAQQ